MMLFTGWRMACERLDSLIWYWHAWRRARATKRRHAHAPYRGILKVGDIYEGCPKSPMVATLVSYLHDDIEGISLLSGGKGSCSLLHCAPVKMTDEELATILS